MDISLDDLYAEHIKLREERLNYYNLITATQNEINIIKSLQKKNKANITKETKKFFEIMLNNHELSIEFSLKNLLNHVDLLDRKENGLPSQIYVMELQSMIMENLENCRAMLDAVRAIKLTYN